VEERRRPTGARKVAGPDKLAEALNAGRLWRAKEILGGRIASQPYSPALYEQFGALLLRLGDDLQAGKFLFLSGVRQPAYEAAIELFIRRHSRTDWQNVVSAFPSAVRRCAWSELPQQRVAGEVRERAWLRVANERPACGFVMR
jgi:hypothetical protein